MHCAATEWSTDAQKYCDIVNKYFLQWQLFWQKKKKTLDIKKNQDFFLINGPFIDSIVFLKIFKN